MTSKKLSPADRRPPRVRLYRKVGILNKAAIGLLVPGGETHVFIIRDKQNQICLKPFVVEGLLGVARVHDFTKEPGRGSSRICLGCLSDVLFEGDYQLIWNDEEEVAVIQPMKKEQEKKRDSNR